LTTDDLVAAETDGVAEESAAPTTIELELVPESVVEPVAELFVESAGETSEIDFETIPIVVAPEMVQEEEEVPVAMKGKKKAKKGKREIAIEQRQAAAKNKKSPIKRVVGEAVNEDLDWQSLRNVKADEILAEEEIVPVEVAVEESEPEE
jgi:hypothetical protein